MPKTHMIRVLIAVAVSLPVCSVAAWGLERRGAEAAEQVSDAGATARNPVVPTKGQRSPRRRAIRRDCGGPID